jgi:mannan endo-1,4-beta-mannosidase
MKTSIITTLLLALGLNCAASPATQLIRRMAKLQKSGVMVGHQDDPVYGHDWKWDQGRSDVKEVCGDYPAVMGFELGDLEMGKAKNLDGVPFDRMRQEIKAQNRRGGIVEISWHPNNPVTGKNAWDPEGKPVGEILPGGKHCKEFAKRMKRVAHFLSTLRDDKGQLIPVIFRPWHEMGGGWFWWGKNSCTTEQYKQLYVYTWQFMKRQGLKNLCGPSLQIWATQVWTTYYPGDKYVDLIGVDLYDFDGSAENYTEEHQARAKPADRNGQEASKTHRPDRDRLAEAAHQKLVHHGALAGH